ncbi:DHAR1 [Scenedesmus sp. PABB004]|nr:DHAR1 [Scenedesmus sp. PABB004]
MQAPAPARSARAFSNRPAARPVRSPVSTMVYKVAVKGDPATQTLGDCPFCHRVLLTLETKGLPYEKEYIDFDHKPQWLVEKSGGKVPVISAGGDDWLPDSDAIVAMLEQQHPEPSMATSVPADVTGGFFGAFRGLLMAKPEEAAEKQAAFGAELGKIEAYLSAHGPFFGGDHLDATDAAMAPKMYHALTALGHFKGLKLDEAKYPAVARYRAALKDLPAWKASDYGMEAIVKGWARHMAA